VSNASGEYSNFVATDYIAGSPRPLIMDLTASMIDIAAGASIGFVSSLENSPEGPFLPVWMTTPPPFVPQSTNVNFFSMGPFVDPLISAIEKARRPLLMPSFDMSALTQLTTKKEDHERYHASMIKYQSNTTNSAFQHPHCGYVSPVFETKGDSNSPIVAILAGVLPMDRYLVNLLPQGINGIDAVLQNSRQSFTYRLDGSTVSSH
jgi:hypothetical protein